MAKRRRNKNTRTVQANGRERGTPGNGIGAHQEVSCMGHATRTPTKKGLRRKADRRAKQKGWV